MKPIKKGMTEAVTRDGRKVSQLTWFDVDEGKYCVAGVLNGILRTWSKEGFCYNWSENDIFAPTEYVYCYAYETPAGYWLLASRSYKNDEEFKKLHPEATTFQRIEASKHEVE